MRTRALALAILFAIAIWSSGCHRPTIKLGMNKLSAPRDFEVVSAMSLLFGNYDPV
jgi:hypothetical protein